MALLTTKADRDDEGDFASLSTLTRRHQDYWTNKDPERKETRIARQYYDGEQLSYDQLEVLKKEGRPAVVYNEIQPNIDGVVGTIERLRQDPKAFPRTPKHEQGAEVATSVLNYALDACNWKAITPRVAKSGALDAVAGVEMAFTEGDVGDREITLKAIDAETFFYDPRSVEVDFSDALYMGVSKWIDVDVAKSMFPGKAQQIEDISTQGGYQEEWNLNDRQNLWVVTNERKIRIVEQWYKRRGEWKYAFYTGGMILQEGKSEFFDEKGRTIPRYIVFSANVDWEGDRYGFVRNLKPIQDEINSRRSLGLKALMATRVYVTEGTVPDVEDLRAEINRLDGVVQTPSGAKFDERDNAAKAQGNLEMLQESKQQMDRRGLSPPVSAEAGAPKDLSGRAIQLLQQAALARIGPFLLSYRDWKLRVYRAMWNQIQRYWSSQRWIRVTDDDGLAQFMPINAISFNEMGLPIIQNQLGSLDVDIVLDEGPDNVTLMQDTFDTLVSLADRGAPVPPDAIIDMSNLPGSMKKKLGARLQQAQQQPNPEVQAQQAKLQMEQQKLQLDMQAKQDDARLEQEKVAAQIQLDREKAEQEAQIAQFRAGNEARLAREKADQEMALERERAANQIEIERIKASATIHTGAMKAEAQAEAMRSRQPASATA